MTLPVLQAKNLSKQFIHRTGLFSHKRVFAVQNVSLKIHEGQVLSILGNAGSGKSTLSRILAGALRPSSGEVLLPESAHRKGWRKQRCSQVRLIPPLGARSLNPRQRIGTQIEAPLKHLTRLSAQDRREKVLHALRAVGLLHEHANYYPSMLTGSDKQLVTIAKALIMEPQVLIFDETLSAMDTTTRQQLLELIHSMQNIRQLAVIMVATNLPLVRQLSTQVMVMDNGQVIEQADTEQFFTAPQAEISKRMVNAYNTLYGRK